MYVGVKKILVAHSITLFSSNDLPIFTQKVPKDVQNQDSIRTFELNFYILQIPSKK